MRKILNKYSVLFLGLVLLISCQEEEPELQTIVVPMNLSVNATVLNDQSGNVTVSPTADDALYFHVIFTPGATPQVLSPGETASFRFTQSGQYQAPVSVIAFGVGGVSSSTTVFLDMDVRLFIDQSTLEMIGGSGSKRWVWDQTVAGHFGVGPLTNNFPEFFSAGPNQLNTCLYDDVLTFSYDDNDNYNFTLDPGANNEVFINWAEVNRFFPDATPGQFVDECRDITTQVPFQENFVIIDNADGTRTLDVGDSFMSYWVVVSGEYEIVELTADKLVLRGISSPFNGDDPLAWYSTFVPEDAGSGGGGEDPVFDTLIFEEEFDTGTLDTATWNYEIGTGENGWGNGESQYYTDRPENIVVEDGMLKITARQENFAGSAYTSSRIQTYQKFEFQYGRVDIRAKLPTGGGTWPALWLLGSDFETNAWPAAGEIDIMEHVGNQQNTIFGSTHDPANFGGNSRSVNTVVEGVSDDFNVYSIIWSENTIRFLINDEEYGALSNSGSLPFNKDFFLILNVAMGGNFGGAIDPAFSSSTMEVDYIRVYQ
ncbi:glycoside hydrolase family 16 protein [Aureicoccus marinus]|uniref:GH16 domain-containing protein n=1 Tax=Aureicoccus marinus TaxID=754435 RepID=A0A2S7T9V7_9FLAO|nr:glycoside hydrolase family 16 protein [Aureicoccus marinus]PQJ16720.1 hypothetical protein BST99_01215 [Aureicoccus marinus]